MNFELYWLSWNDRCVIATVGVEPDVLFPAVDNCCPTGPIFDCA